jgi:hypothetical protein
MISLAIRTYARLLRPPQSRTVSRLPCTAKDTR